MQADAIAHYMLEEEFLVRQDNGLYALTNLGAILLAKRLADFPKITRKAVRVIQYNGNNRLNMLKEDVGGKGYVVGFEGLIRFISALIPTQEVIQGALRERSTCPPGRGLNLPVTCCKHGMQLINFGFNAKYGGFTTNMP